MVGVEGQDRGEEMEGEYNRKEREENELIGSGEPL